MILSQTAVYALNAIVRLARCPEGERVRVDDMASELDVPRNYLSKILHQLARDGLLTSTRGPGGGFTLATPPKELSLHNVVRRFDDLSEESGCLLGRGRCSDHDPCSAHEHWKDVSRAVSRFLQETTVADLAEGHPPAHVTSIDTASRGGE